MKHNEVPAVCGAGFELFGFALPRPKQKVLNSWMRSDRAALWGLNCCCERGRRLQKSAWSQKNNFSCFNRRIKEKRWLNTSRDSERVNQLLCVFTQRVQTASAQSRDPLKTHFMRLSSLLHPVHVSCLCMVGVPEADEHLKGLLSAPPVFLHSQSV